MKDASDKDKKADEDPHLFHPHPLHPHPFSSAGATAPKTTQHSAVSVPPHVLAQCTWGQELPAAKI